MQPSNTELLLEIENQTIGLNFGESFQFLYQLLADKSIVSNVASFITSFLFIVSGSFLISIYQSLPATISTEIVRSVRKSIIYFTTVEMYLITWKCLNVVPLVSTGSLSFAIFTFSHHGCGLCPRFLLY